MLPIAYVAHHAGARLRLRVPARKGEAAYFARAERELAACAGVAYAEANPLTASLLLQYQGDLAELAAAADAAAIFALELPVVPGETALDLVADRVEHLEQRLRQASRGALDLETLVFLGLVGASVVQLGRGQALAPASTLLTSAVALLALRRARRRETAP